MKNTLITLMFASGIVASEYYQIGWLENILSAWYIIIGLLCTLLFLFMTTYSVHKPDEVHVTKKNKDKLKGTGVIIQICIILSILAGCGWFWSLGFYITSILSVLCYLSVVKVVEE